MSHCLCLVTTLSNPAAAPLLMSTPSAFNFFAIAEIGKRLKTVNAELAQLEERRMVPVGRRQCGQPLGGVGPPHLGQRLDEPG